jgi:hypothetical protein
MTATQLDYLRYHLEMEMPPDVAALGPIEASGVATRPDRVMAVTFILFFGTLGWFTVLAITLTAHGLTVLVRLGIIGGGLVGLALCALLAWGLLVGFRRFACVICTRGLLWRRGRDLRAYRWEQLECVYADITPIHEKVNGQHVERCWYGNPRLVMDDGATLTLPSEFPGYRDVNRAFAQHVKRLFYPPAEAAVRGGRLVAFGKELAVAPDVLLWRDRRIPWQAVSHLSTGEDYVLLHLHGKAEPEFIGTLIRVPNVEVLIVLGNALAGRTA